MICSHYWKRKNIIKKIGRSENVLHLSINFTSQDFECYLTMVYVKKCVKILQYASLLQMNYII